jgi:hypothetical protein
VEEKLGGEVVWFSFVFERTVGRIAGGLGMESWVALRVWLVWRLVWLWRCVSFQPRKHTYPRAAGLASFLTY